MESCDDTFEIVKVFRGDIWDTFALIPSILLKALFAGGKISIIGEKVTLINSARWANS